MDKLHNQVTPTVNCLKKLNFSKLLLIILAISIIFVIYLCRLHQHAFVSTLSQILLLDGPKALLYFCGIYILSNVLCIPIGLPLNLFAGMLWGTLWGGAIINLLATLSAAISFLAVRLFMQHFMEDVFNKYFALSKFKKLIDCHDWQFIVAARINPIVPFSISNYLFGFIPELTFKRYIVSTIVANFIPAFAFASVGSALKTFSLDDSNVRTMLTKIACVMFLLSILFLIKWLLPKKRISRLEGAN